MGFEKLIVFHKLLNSSFEGFSVLWDCQKSTNGLGSLQRKYLVFVLIFMGMEVL